jgi:hypothetical protein
MTTQLMIHEKKALGKGYGQYNVEKNSKSWEPYLGADGSPLSDPDTGQPMMMLKKIDGTVTCAYDFRILYHLLKKAWKAAHSG